MKGNQSPLTGKVFQGLGGVVGSAVNEVASFVAGAAVENFCSSRSNSAIRCSLVAMRTLNSALLRATFFISFSDSCAICLTARLGFFHKFLETLPSFFPFLFCGKARCFEAGRNLFDERPNLFPITLLRVVVVNHLTQTRNQTG